MTQVESFTVAVPEEAAPLTPRQLMRRRALGHTGFLIGAGLIIALALIALFAPLIAPHDPFVQSLSSRMLPPVWDDGGTWEHILGTDQNGRDYLSRLIYGARVSISIGLGAATIGMLIGVTLGVIAGYFGGWVDHGVSFLLTAQLALPGLLLAMALVFIIGPSIWVVICIIGVLHWTYYLVVTRSATQRIRNLDFVAAAAASGATPRQIIWHEIVPNLISQIIVIFTFELGIAILAEASLSFLGVGIQPPTPSWGLMIAEGKEAMFYRPWLVVLPGLCLFTLVIGANLMGDGLRDITAPEGRN
ncbi:ABC transporter permease [Actibacterium lipolyticum]|uniref:Glutathione transport system permease protein GsiD n=1 Tax=Actibacterium lipolyticum TaxID=1524263 RepID=A0A238KM38_9RHOB|nr:ABC transporter permease [Actibacterium lipolyticum]SMX43798.1 Glutathione transport system permease protein GsiD [Actibacterium lipolyticum]